MKWRAAIRASAVFLLGASGIVALVHACVPADTRPIPATLLLTVAPSRATTDGVVTADGWTLAFERVLVGIGRSSISSSCARYSEADYDRLLELQQRGGSPQQLASLFGIGHCDVRFRVGIPSSEALLGEGTSADDLAFMRTRGQDRWVNRGGVALRVVGTARRGAETKRFDFVFRTQIRYSACSLAADAGGLLAIDPDGGDEPLDAGAGVDAGVEAEAPPPVGVGEVLHSEATVERQLRIEPERLFAMPDEPAIRFDPYSRADTNADGVVTVDELVAVPINVVHDAGPFEAGLNTANGPVDPTGPGNGFTRLSRSLLVESLGDYVVIVLLPRLLRYGDVGGCGASLTLDLGRPDGGFGPPR